MEDVELNDMIPDLCELMRRLEWWQSGDYGEEAYREEVAKFKAKWFGTRDQKLRELVVKELVEVQKRITDL
jgi:hypothetical protein